LAITVGGGDYGLLLSFLQRFEPAGNNDGLFFTTRFPVPTTRP
jgi:hypothetical protein